jgi:hypothetical protein
MIMALFYSTARQTFLFTCCLLLVSGVLLAQDQSRESMAVDATAAQWSFQFAYEGKFDYKSDIMANGLPRPEGDKGFGQFRLVAPVAKSDSWPITLLPRLTMRMVQNKDDEFGFGASDLFVLGIAQQWSSGRWGLGPQVNFPASDQKFGSTKWGYGLAGAITQRALDDDLFLALLLQQTWREGGDGTTRAMPLGINIVAVYQLGKGFYIGNGDFVISYNWQDKSFLVPLLLRFGKAWIGDTSTWNAYFEYGFAAYYDDWIGPVSGQILRLNVQFQIPVG